MHKFQSKKYFFLLVVFMSVVVLFTLVFNGCSIVIPKIWNPTLELVVHDVDMAPGTMQQLKAYMPLADGSAIDLTSTVTWTSDMPDVATVSDSGLVTAYPVAEDTTCVISVVSGTVTSSVTAEANITVKKGYTISLISVRPAFTGPISIAKQMMMPYKAMGTFKNSNGTDTFTQDLTNQATWTSTLPEIATVDSHGWALGLTTGSAVLNASFGGETSNPLDPGAMVTVDSRTLIPNPELDSYPILITDAHNGSGYARLAALTALQLKATGFFDDNTSQDITRQVIWKSSNTTSAVVDEKGVVTAFEPSFLLPVLITATSGNITGSRNIKVYYPSTSGSTSGGMGMY